jgi:hypothetical protein
MRKAMTFDERLILLERRAAQQERRAAQQDRRAAQHEREMAGIRKLISIGMKLLNRNDEQIRLLARDMRALAVAQKRTEEALRGFLESRRGSNGHSKRKIDLQ